MIRRVRWGMRCATLVVSLLLVLQGSQAQEKTVIVRRDLLPEVNTSIPAAVDSALRCGLAGLPAAGIALLEQPRQSVRGSGRMEALIAGLQAGMYSELGMMQTADDLFTRYRDGILALPYAPYGACLRASLALHQHRMGRREEAFNLISGSARLSGDVTMSRAVASGRYHLGVLMHWEGAETEALEHFSAAAHTAQTDPTLQADAARYWAAYAEALERDGQMDRAALAWLRALEFARADPLTRLRLAPAIAIARSEMMLRQGRPADAEAHIEYAAWPVVSRGTAALHGRTNEVTARIAFARGSITSAQRLLREAIVEYLLALSDAHEACTMNERERIARRLQSVIDLAFSSMLHDSLHVPELPAAAWNAHLALRSLLRAGNMSLAAAGETAAREAAAKEAAAEEAMWFRMRVENEQCFLPDEPLRTPRQRPRLHTQETTVHIPTLQSFAGALPADHRGMVLRRFIDVRGDGAACYAAVAFDAHAAALPRMTWIDVSGAFETRVLPAYARSLRAPLALEGVHDWSALARALPLLTPDSRAWQYCGAPLLQAAQGSPLVLLPDGMFTAMNPAAVYNGASGRYLHEDVDIELICALPASVKRQALRDALSARVAVSRPSDDARGMPPEAVFVEKSVGGECEKFLHAADAADGADAVNDEQRLRARLEKGGCVRIDAPVMQMESANALETDSFLPHARRGSHPAERSGLLAGDKEAFTAAHRRQYAMHDDDDGVLLASEIGAMDLRGTDCVLLARCGDLPCASLPRDAGRCLLQSFIDAGAPAVVHTLWYMPKQVTRDFLTALRTRLEAGDDVREAFTAARAKLRSRFDHPYFWGSYQLLLAEMK